MVLVRLWVMAALVWRQLTKGLGVTVLPQGVEGPPMIALLDCAGLRCGRSGLCESMLPTYRARRGGRCGLSCLSRWDAVAVGMCVCGCVSLRCCVGTAAAARW